MKQEVKGLIFDIQGYSVHDGPGCRTQVFMKGCPLRCEWCSNPEGMRTAQDIMFRNTKCVNRNNGCRRCIDACPHHAIVQNQEQTEDAQQLLINHSLCNRCAEHACLSVCYFEGLRCCGEWWTVDSLMHVFERNRHYWGVKGGASFSGGEPLQQNQFMQAVLEACRETNIHIAIETSAQIEPRIFLRLMSMVDFAFIDIKHMDPQRHHEKTGASNDWILRNIENLVKARWPGRLVLRFTVIESFNDTDENIEDVVKLMQRLDLFEINILPFHRLGYTKWTQLGKEYLFKDKIETPKEKMTYIQDIFLNKHIACYIGPDTPF